MSSQSDAVAVELRQMRHEINNLNENLRLQNGRVRTLELWQASLRGMWDGAASSRSSKLAFIASAAALLNAIGAWAAIAFMLAQQ